MELAAGYINPPHLNVCYVSIASKADFGLTKSKIYTKIRL